MNNKIGMTALFQTLILGLVVFLSSCAQEFEGGDDRSVGINERGRELYNETCASCHGPSGEGGSGGALIACTACTGGVESLITKIERDMPSAANPMRGNDAADVAEYVIAAFNEGATGSVQRALPGVATMSPKEAIYKISFELAGRLPTNAEVDRFTESLKGEREVVFSYMETDYFYERLKDMFNDSLLTDYARSENTGNGNSVENLYSNFRKPVSVGSNTMFPVYPNLNWEDAVGGDLSTTYLDYFTDEALGRRPLLFVEYLARNNRNFKEFVSGKYTVVNRFSYEALGGDASDSNVRLVNPDISLGNGASAPVTNTTWKTFKNVAEVQDYLDVVELYGNINTNGDHYVIEDFPYDPRDIKAAQIFYDLDDSGTVSNEGVPHSGVITDEVFLNKYTATETNMHRNRARMVYWFFAAKDLLAIEGNRDASQLVFEDFELSVGEIDPTNSNPDCAVCHDVMDPVAAAFENYSLSGVYDTRNPDEVAPHDDTIGWGLNSAQIKTTGTASVNYDSRELQWLGEQIANDPAFSKGIAQIVFKGMTGQEILGEPSQDSPNSYRQAYSQQARLISTAASEFAAADYNIKELVYAITKSAFYRSTGLFYDGFSEDYAQIGSVRYLQPQILNQKLRALNSGGWGVASSGNSNALDLRSTGNRAFIGGKNSVDVFKDADSVSGVISAITERLAVDEACDIVRNEFSDARLERTLFRFVEDDTDMIASSSSSRLNEMQAIRSNIAFLYLAVLHQEVSTDSEEVDIAFDLFTEAYDVLESGVSGMTCNTGTNNAAERQVRGAWYAVMVYLLTDYRFIYG